MTVAPIHDEVDYDAALADVDALMDAEPGTADGDRLDVLVTLIEAYESKHWAIDPPDPVDALLLRMEQRGLTRADLEVLLGGSGRVSEILNRKRPLSMEMMRRLHRELGIPAASFFLEPPRSGRGRRSATRATRR